MPDIMESALHWALAYTGSGIPAMSIPFLMGSHLLQSQLPGEHTVVLFYMAHSTC